MLPSPVDTDRSDRSGLTDGTIARLFTKVGRYASAGIRASLQMSLMAAGVRLSITQPLMHADIGKRRPFHSGAIASSSA